MYGYISTYQKGQRQTFVKKKMDVSYNGYF